MTKLGSCREIYLIARQHERRLSIGSTCERSIGGNFLLDQGIVRTKRIAGRRLLPRWGRLRLLPCVHTHLLSIQDDLEPHLVSLLTQHINLRIATNKHRKQTARRCHYNTGWTGSYRSYHLKTSRLV